MNIEEIIAIEKDSEKIIETARLEAQELIQRAREHQEKEFADIKIKLEKDYEKRLLAQKPRLAKTRADILSKGEDYIRNLGTQAEKNKNETIKNAIKIIVSSF